MFKQLCSKPHVMQAVDQRQYMQDARLSTHPSPHSHADEAPMLVVQYVSPDLVVTGGEVRCLTT